MRNLWKRICYQFDQIMSSGPLATCGMLFTATALISELYMKPASNYVALGVPVDSYTLTQSAAQKGEIYLGYRKNKDGNRNVIVNPEKIS